VDKILGTAFLLPVYWLSFLMPRDKGIGLFGSTFGRRFADNPRYFYLYCRQHIEYEWFVRQAEECINITEKYVNEFLGGTVYEAVRIHGYQKEIVIRFCNTDL